MGLRGVFQRIALIDLDAHLTRTNHVEQFLAQGHQVGGGSGKTAATIIGAVGGALVGRAIEQNTSRGQGVYRVTVQLDNGGARTFDYAEPPNVQVGERVRVDGNQLYR